MLRGLGKIEIGQFEYLEVPIIVTIHCLMRGDVNLAQEVSKLICMEFWSVLPALIFFETIRRPQNSDFDSLLVCELSIRLVTK